MAEGSLAPVWVPVRREVKPARFSPYIKIRAGGFFFSTDFVRKANIASTTRANVYLSSDGYRIGFRFHDDESDDSYPLQPDGGSGKRVKADGRVIQARPSRMSPVIAALLKNKESASVRFEPKKDVHGVWFIELVPSFEKKYSSSSDVSGNESGIYRYRLGDKTVYIGRGQIRNRLADPFRKEWEYDSIEFSVLNSEEAEARWESHWLDRHRHLHGSLPTYNRIGGIGAMS